MKAEPQHPEKDKDAPSASQVDGVDPDETEAEPTSNPEHVRVAGRKQMDLPPGRWDIVDEQADESFPASDPPGNY